MRKCVRHLLLCGHAALAEQGVIDPRRASSPAKASMYATVPRLMSRRRRLRSLRCRTTSPSAGLDFKAWQVATIVVMSTTAVVSRSMLCSSMSAAQRNRDSRCSRPFVTFK